MMIVLHQWQLANRKKSESDNCEKVITAEVVCVLNDMHVILRGHYKEKLSSAGFVKYLIYTKQEIESKVTGLFKNVFTATNKQFIF